jgi:hypothetical protein
MTTKDSVSLDEQIDAVSSRGSVLSATECEYILASLRRLKEIDNAELPEPVAYSVGYELRWCSGREVTNVYLYGPEVADRLAAAEEALARCKRNSAVTMDELGEMRDARDLAEARLKALTEVLWNSVKNKLPDDDMTVLIVMEDGEVWTGYMDGDSWRYVSGDTMQAAVTHWMHMPEPPAAALKQCPPSLP